MVDKQRRRKARRKAARRERREMNKMALLRLVCDHVHHDDEGRKFKVREYDEEREIWFCGLCKFEFPPSKIRGYSPAIIWIDESQEI